MLANKKRAICRAIFPVFLVLSFTGCGGGGGDSTPAVQPLTYVGNTNPADITLANAPTLVANVLYGGETASGVPTGVLVSTSETDNGNAATVSGRLVSLLDYSIDNFIGNAISGYYIPQAVVIDETINCYQGYYTFKGTVDDATGVGTLTISYVECVLDGVTYNGSGTMTINYIDIYTGAFGATMDFILLTMTGPDISGSISGSITIDEYIYGNQVSEMIVLNIVAKDDVLNKMFKFDNYAMNFSVTDIYDLYSSATISISGTVYDSIHGGISIQTMSPLSFSSQLNTYPDSGGPIIMTGNNSRMQLTVESEKHVLLELDLDNNGTYEIVRYVLWQEIDDHTNLNLADTDNDGMHDSWEILFGLDPNIDDAGDDTDTDTYLNLDEYQGGSNPQNMSSIPTAP